MGKIVGKVTDAVGLTNNKGEAEAAKAAGFASAQQYALTKESIALQKETLQFQKDQYGDWKAIYGDIQENLGDYYKNLSGEKLVALGLENQQREYQAAVKTIEREAAQRGISGSGLEFASKSTATFQNAEARARIRSLADEQVAAQQLSFLGVGLGQGTQMLGTINQASANVNQAYGTGINAYGNSASSYLNRSTQLSQSNTSTMGQIWGVGAGYNS